MYFIAIRRNFCCFYFFFFRLRIWDCFLKRIGFWKSFNRLCFFFFRLKHLILFLKRIRFCFIFFRLNLLNRFLKWIRFLNVRIRTISDSLFSCSWNIKNLCLLFFKNCFQITNFIIWFNVLLGATCFTNISLVLFFNSFWFFFF